MSRLLPGETSQRVLDPGFFEQMLPDAPVATLQDIIDENRAQVLQEQQSSNNPNTHLLASAPVFATNDIPLDTENDEFEYYNGPTVFVSWGFIVIIGVIMVLMIASLTALIVWLTSPQSRKILDAPLTFSQQQQQQQQQQKTKEKNVTAKRKTIKKPKITASSTELLLKSKCKYESQIQHIWNEKPGVTGIRFYLHADDFIFPSPAPPPTTLAAITPLLDETIITTTNNQKLNGSTSSSNNSKEKVEVKTYPLLISVVHDPPANQSMSVVIYEETFAFRREDFDQEKVVFMKLAKHLPSYTYSIDKTLALRFKHLRLPFCTLSLHNSTI